MAQASALSNNLTIAELEERLQAAEAEQAALAAALANRLQATNSNPTSPPRPAAPWRKAAQDRQDAPEDAWRGEVIQVMAVDPLRALEEREHKQERQQQQQQVQDEESGRITELVAANRSKIIAQELAQLLGQTPLSERELCLLYQYKHGTDLREELRGHGLRLDAVLTASSLFQLSGGKVSLRRHCQEQDRAVVHAACRAGSWRKTTPPPAPPGLLTPPEEKTDAEDDCWNDLLRIVCAPSGKDKKVVAKEDTKEAKKKGPWAKDPDLGKAPALESELRAAFPPLPQVPTARELAAERAEVERKEAERKQVERREVERAEFEAARADLERKLNAERAEFERKKAERREVERKEEERAELERKEVESAELKRKEAERAELDRKEAERAELEHKEAARKSVERAVMKRKEEAERAELVRKEAERAELEVLMAERAEVACMEAESAELERKLEAERVALERNLEAERAALERKTCERKKAERAELERKERVELERQESERKKAERAELERKKAKRVELERKERVELERQESERKEAERAELQSAMLEKCKLVKLEKRGKLGMELQPTERGLLVVAIKPDHCVAKHNKKYPDSALRPQDLLVAVNGACGSAAMVQELAADAPLRIHVDRREEKDKKEAREKLSKAGELELLRQAQWAAKKERVAGLLRKLEVEGCTASSVADKVQGWCEMLACADGAAASKEQAFFFRLVYGLFAAVLLGGCQAWGLQASASLTFGAWVTFLSQFLLCVQVKAQGSAHGLSSTTLQLQIWSTAARLWTTCSKNGYLPVDNSGDFAYQCGDAGTLACSLFLAWSLRAHSDADDPRLPAAVWIVAAAAVLACFVHPELNNSWPWDVLWMTSCWLDAVVLAPQLLLRDQLQKKERVAEVLTAQSVITACIGRVCTLIFWGLGWQELRPREWTVNLPGFSVMLSCGLAVALSAEIAHTFLQDKSKAAQKASRAESKAKQKLFPGLKSSGAFR